MYRIGISIIKKTDNMGLFKNLFGNAVDEMKKNLEDSKREMLKSLNETKREALGNLGNKSSEAFKSDDEDVRIKIGTLTDGVLVIKEGFKKLKENSLEDYKNLRKIVFPSTLNELEEGAIDGQERLEELDFSKVTLLTKIPEDFISGKTHIKSFVVPEGVRTLEDDFLGSTETIKEVYIPSSVSSIGCIANYARNSIDVYLYASGLDLEDMHDNVKTLYVLAQDYDDYAEQLSEYDSDARIRTMPDEKFSFYNEKMSERVETSTIEEPRKQRVEIVTKATPGNGQVTGKKIWWVNDLTVLYDGNKYALKYTGKQGQITKYIYDDVDILNEYQVRFAKKQADGSLRYGVASTCGWSFIMTDCEYIKVTFLDGIGAVLAVDEENDEYAIDRWGKIFSIEGYREKVAKDLADD